MASTTPTGTRDLEGARNAYESKDLEASRAAHAAKVNQEEHSQYGDVLKSVVYGGLDGIITTFAVVSGSTGGSLGIGVILVLGFANLFPNALSMGMGDALSTKAENEYILAEKGREEWEFEMNKPGEIDEMVDIYMEKGVERADAEDIINTMAKYPDFFINIMMVQELELIVPDEDDNPFKDGAVTFVSFVLFGAVPLLGYVVLGSAGLSVFDLFLVSCVLTAITLFGLGAIKTKFSNQKWYRGGFEILVLGSITAAVAYVAAFLIEKSVAKA